MKVSTLSPSVSDRFVLSLSYDEFIHLYSSICAILSEDNSDKFLVELESRMIDIL